MINISSYQNRHFIILCGGQNKFIFCLDNFSIIDFYMFFQILSFVIKYALFLENIHLLKDKTLPFFVFLIVIDITD